MLQLYYVHVIRVKTGSMVETAPEFIELPVRLDTCVCLIYTRRSGRHRDKEHTRYDGLRDMASVTSYRQDGTYQNYSQKVLGNAGQC